METISKHIVVFSSMLIFFTILTRSVNPCQPASCDGPFGPEIRFPFRLKNRQPAGCGYPGFDLFCDSKNQTILRLPRSGDFRVSYINYKSPAISINDPDNCLPSRILNFSLAGSPFEGDFMMRYTFVNCSSGWTRHSLLYPVMRVDCLSGRNYTVFAMNTQLSPSDIPPTCRKIVGVSVPVRLSGSGFYYRWSTDLEQDLLLVWNAPTCGDCEYRGGFCGYIGSGREIGCSRSFKSGLSRGAKYGIIIGVGIPVLLFTLGLLCYVFGALKAQHRRSSQVSEPRVMIRTVGGLDLPTIASYPKTVLGESGRLPKPADGTCPICLCEYQPKEALRSIPECNHYFHADCVDEWLKLNGTCPLCRNSPQGSLSSSTPSSTLV